MYDKEVSFIVMVPFGCNLGFGFTKVNEIGNGNKKFSYQWDDIEGHSYSVGKDDKYNERNIMKSSSF
ncbi:MAG: hypothetical protein GX359_02095 [Clostridiales bacterium]|nr:hypothetical protein [Clostridiales bacterium]